MRKMFIAAVATAALMSASAANAASLLFNFNLADSYVHVLENNTLCLGSCALSASLALPLPTDLAIDEGQSATFDFAKFHVNGGLGLGSAVLEAALAFTTPSLDVADTYGNAFYARAGTFRHPGLLGGVLTWDDSPQYFTTANGGAFSVTFNNIAGFTPGGDAKGSVTIHVDSAGAVPEPAAWAMMIAGFGLAGATLRRQRALAA